MKKRLAFVLLLALLAPAGVSADAVETGALSGHVRTGDGKAIPGAAVVLTDDRGSRPARADQNGFFRFGLLRPGSYTVRASMEPFAEARGETTITAGGSATMELVLRLATAETVEVVAEAPLVDKFNVVAGATVKGDLAGETSAVNRTMYGAIDLLPGVTHDDESLYLSNSRPSVNGSLWQEQNVYIDGVDATYSMRGGGTRVFFPSIAVEEVSLEAAGAGSEYGRNVGSHTNMIVKSGTNRFHGELMGVFARDRWNSNYDSQPALAEEEDLVANFELQNERAENEEDKVDPEQAAADFLVFGEGERDGGSDNLEASLGGPIVRDRAWFFVSRGEVSTDQLDKLTDGTVLDVSSDFETTLAKITAQPGASHSLTLTWIDSPTRRLFLLPEMHDRWTTTLFDLSGDVASLAWNTAASRDLFVEAKVAAQTSHENRSRPFPPSLKATDPDFATNPAFDAFAPVNNDASFVQRFDNSWHNGWIFPLGYGTNEFPRDQANAAVSQFLGRHELRYGVDFQRVDWEQRVRRPDIFSGDVFDVTRPWGYEDDCLEISCVMLDYNPPDVVAAGRGASSSEGRNLGIYLRDRFEVGAHFVFSVGARWEEQTLRNDRGRDVIDSRDLSPRLSAVYDVGGNGRQLVSLSAGRFYNQTPQNLVNTNLQEDWTGASNALDYALHANSLGFLGFLPTAEARCDFLAGVLGIPSDPTKGPYCFPLGSTRPGELWRIHDDPTFGVDIDIEPYHRDEIVLGYEWQFARSWVFDAKAIWWRLDDLIGSTLQRDADFGIFRLVENYGDYALVLRRLGWVENFVANGIGTRERAEEILDRFEDDNRSYRALQLQLNRRFHRGWALYNNVTLGRAEGRTYGDRFDNLNDDYGRNLEFLLTDDLVDQIDCSRWSLGDGCAEHLRAFVGEPLSTIHRHGIMPIGRDLIFKSYGFKQWRVAGHELSIGGNFFYQSGSRWERVQSVFSPPTSIEDRVFSVEPVRVFLEPRGSIENGAMWSLNLSGGWRFPLGRPGLRGLLRVESYNVINRQQQISTNSETGSPRRSRRSFQRPRTFRLVVGVEF